MSLSHGHIEEGGKRVMHYTVSSRKENMLTYATVRKLAVVIQQLEKHSGSYEIIEKQNSLFHDQKQVLLKMKIPWVFA